MDYDNQYGQQPGSVPDGQNTITPDPQPGNQYGYGNGPQPGNQYGYNNGPQPDYGQNQNPNRQEKRRGHSSMALASLIMGIIGIVTSCCCYGGIIFGSLGIIFSILSKTGDSFEGYSLAGLITSIVGMVLAFLALIFIIASGVFSGMGGLYY